MDNFTHTLTGPALARAGIAGSTPGATLALVLASNVPDADLGAGTEVVFRIKREAFRF